MTVSGRDLGDRALFSGPAGDVVIDIQRGGGNDVFVWVPLEVIATRGTHTVTILGGPSGDSNAFPFDVVAPPDEPLQIAGPEEIAVPTLTREGEIVYFEVRTWGGQDPNPVVTCNPPSGSRFPFGMTNVICEATNKFGERVSDGFLVIVYDVTKPDLTIPDNMVVRAEGRDGAVVTWNASANDNIDGPVEVTCIPESGSRFPVGRTTVDCTAIDMSNNVAEGTFNVDVVGDEGHLVIHVPDPIMVEAEGAYGAVVTFTVTANGTADPDPDISCTPVSGSIFPLGTTTVQCTATDDAGNTASDDFDVTVTDSTAPVISRITANPDVLVPPNHKMVEVKVTVEASDVVDAMPSCRIFDVTSNETINGDVNVTGDLTVELRATRQHDERQYIVHVRCTDFSDNAEEGTVTVRVPLGNDQTAAPVTTPRKTFKKWW